MGRRAKQRQPQQDLWIAHTELPRTVGHPFYEKPNQLLEEGKFDEFVEGQCEGFYAETMAAIVNQMYRPDSVEPSQEDHIAGAVAAYKIQPLSVCGP